MARPGGRTTAEAVREAEAGLDSHREDGMRSLAATLARLEAVCAAREEGAEAQVYELASAFADMAGFFDTGPLYAAAFSLCETSDRMIAGACWQWPSVEVHLRAVRLILAAGCDANETSRLLLGGLATIVARLPKQPG
ncbi:chemotaxis protein CheE [Brevundimonas sp.]|uniref:chemotaxis protein CheE n=1 Tax=Brevundimonas sp. TaxID=1871086 RepID=UPI002D6CB514|nr:chemotaxis protein CheE [Brevundimonas sp.]HYC96410.1 chemotaxis protein CheE [Brevundimonas sp.]